MRLTALVSRGNLTGAANEAATSPSAATVDVSWTDNSGSGSALATGQALILIYNAAQNKGVFTTAGSARSTRTESISRPSEYTGDEVEVLGFISEDGSKVPNSSYIDSVTVA